MPPLTFFFYLLLVSICNASSSAGNRYSFSLTTFDPSGKLGQVVRAVEAASLGVPIVAVALSDRIVLAAPQKLPSLLMQDDGTPRFTRISPELVVAQTGLSADGRVLCAAAQHLALNHLYTFNEDIPVDTFLQGMSLVFQENTMKPGRRPFGATLVVAYVPSRQNILQNKGTVCPKLFRIDPSGSITSLDNCNVVNGKGDDTDQLMERLKASSGQAEEDIVANWFHEQLTHYAKKNRVESVPERILLASISSDGRFRKERKDIREDY
eukprot:scaffold362_cov176-Amphora_coffeaeformis.AAC.2